MVTAGYAGLEKDEILDGEQIRFEYIQNLLDAEGKLVELFKQGISRGLDKFVNYGVVEYKFDIPAGLYFKLACYSEKQINEALVDAFYPKIYHGYELTKIIVFTSKPRINIDGSIDINLYIEPK